MAKTDPINQQKTPKENGTPVTSETATKGWNFFRHLWKQAKKGDFHPLRQGLPGLLKQYEVYKERKTGLTAKYETYETVIAGASDTREYYVLLILSCLIATFGLFQDSAAVIIGAMIVAPLMGPILGLSAGVLWGSGKDIGEAVTTLLKSIAIVLGIAALFSWLTPFLEVTAQIEARTAPGLLDIGVALASGLVGAYAYVNKKIAGSLAGVAIAVALMPPLSTVGIGLGRMNWEIARGAALLFAINLLGISLAALFVFWLVGLHPHVTADENQQKAINRRAIGQVVLSLLLLGAIAVPLGYLSYTTVQRNDTSRSLEAYLRTQVPDYYWGWVEWSGPDNAPALALTIRGRFENIQTKAWETELSKLRGGPVRLRVFVLEEAGLQAE